MPISIRIAAATALCLLALAPSALAAPDRTGEVAAGKTFAWEGTAMPSIDLGGQNAAPCSLPGAYCDSTLIKAPLGGKLTIKMDVPDTSDYDPSIYESDASGKQGKLVASPSGFVGDDETVAVGETSTDYYLVVTSYFLTLADPYKAVASFEPGITVASRIGSFPAKVKASKLKGFKGGAEGEVAKVEIALAMSKGSGCQSLQANGAFKKSGKGEDGTCAPAKWLAAKGTTAWSFKLRKRLKKGSYVLFSRASDSSGQSETEFGEAAGNRKAFRVS